MEDRKHHVLQVAQRLFLEKGFAQTSIQDIVNGAEISKGTFYNYFSSKNECLITILEHAQKEAANRRQQLLVNEKKNDVTVFVKQIVIRMQVNQEQNLLPLFGYVFHSKDQELQTFAKTYHLKEIAWLADRFTDIYGKELEAYSVDCAIFLLGLLQQYSLNWSLYADDEIDIESLVAFILRKIDSLTESFIEQAESFVHVNLLNMIRAIEADDDDPSSLLIEFQDFVNRHLKEGRADREYANFIMEEMKKKDPQVFILKQVVEQLFANYDAIEESESLKKRILEQWTIE